MLGSSKQGLNSQINRLFVYGTLQPGEANAYLLSEVHGKWIKARVKGTLWPQGTATTEYYPALILDGKRWINGWLLSSPLLENHWQRLDAFEGDGYRRVITEAVTDRNERVKAFVYEAKG